LDTTDPSIVAEKVTRHGVWAKTVPNNIDNIKEKMYFIFIYFLY